MNLTSLSSLPLVLLLITAVLSAPPRTTPDVTASVIVEPSLVVLGSDVAITGTITNNESKPVNIREVEIYVIPNYPSGCPPGFDTPYEADHVSVPPGVTTISVPYTPQCAGTFTVNFYLRFGNSSTATIVAVAFFTVT